MKADLTFLSSPELEGRLSLQRGSEVAVQWIASEFTKAGIKPVIQKTALIEFKMDAQASGLTVKTSAGTKTYRSPDATAAFPQDVDLSAPVVFDKPGSAAIGCNIHDHMTAYVNVTDAPWANVTDQNGRTVLVGLQAGQFIATVWHPRLRPKTAPPTREFALESADFSFAIALSVLPPKRPRLRDY